MKDVVNSEENMIAKWLKRGARELKSKFIRTSLARLRYINQRLIRSGERKYH